MELPATRRITRLALLDALLADRRVAAAAGLGFSSGLPLLLVYVTQSAWLSEAGVSIRTLGLLTELTLAYKLKFLWAPFLDRFDPPVLGALLGRRRGWIFASQLLVVATLIGIGTGDPANRLAMTVAFSLALGFAGATQDVVIDGWRIAVAPDKQAVMSSWAEIGWRIGNLAGGAGALILADHVGWHAAYLAMAVLMLPGMVTAWLAPEPDADRERAASPEASTEAKLVPRLSIHALFATIAAPVVELVRRLGWMALPTLLLIGGFRMSGYVSSAMEVPLFKHLHYSNTDIATVTKLFGFWVALGATALGGVLVPRIGMMATLLIGTVAGSTSHLALAWLAAHGDRGGGEFWFFAFTVSLDSFAYAFASIVLITYMSKLCAQTFAASQFALMTSLVALPGSFLAMGSGYVIEGLGYPRFFIGTSLIGAPVALLCLYVWHHDARMRRAGPDAPAPPIDAMGSSVGPKRA